MIRYRGLAFAVRNQHVGAYLRWIATGRIAEPPNIPKLIAEVRANGVTHAEP